MALAVLAGLACGLVLGAHMGWHARTWPHPDDSDKRREVAAMLDALDRIHDRVRAR